MQVYSFLRRRRPAHQQDLLRRAADPQAHRHRGVLPDRTEPVPEPGQPALRMLRSKLVEIKEREHLDKISDIKGVQQKIEWGSQIRNYVFMPYTLVKDTRTGCETVQCQRA